ncbi:creatininase family protein [Pelagibius sp. Alg239-R121]|uniref:creatininase family protein n=1 Tax=Pelagibius sp. Alg239-R121 TaxID=2993448 RepID=UPI0024A73E4B|nr:creatininase family protein [Pelagibius sp. Alg239-R121]
MKLQMATWLEVEEYLKTSRGIIIPVGSTEQHGPIGLIGTDAFCAEKIAEDAAEQAGAIVAPTLALTPAPFNMDFPGTISLSEGLFKSLVSEVVDGLMHHGFEQLYFLNAHGANLAPLSEVAADRAETKIRVRSWWDFENVNSLRNEYYGRWEGMHATPSEVAITQAAFRLVPPHPLAETPPELLSAEYLQAHSGDRHGPPAEHRERFPDGRVGAHSAMAKPSHGEQLLKAASKAVARDYQSFLGI